MSQLLSPSPHLPCLWGLQGLDTSLTTSPTLEGLALTGGGQRGLWGSPGRRPTGSAVPACRWQGREPCPGSQKWLPPLGAQPAVLPPQERWFCLTPCALAAPCGPLQPPTWPRTGGGLRVFTGSLYQAVCGPWQSMGEGKATGTHAWPSRWLLWPGQACTGSPPPPLTPVHQRSPAGGAARTVGHGVCAPRAGGSRRAWRHTAWDRPGTSSRQTLLGAVTAPPVRPGFLGSELRAGLLADRLPAPLQLPLPSSVSEAHRPTRPIEGSDASQGSG